MPFPHILIFVADRGLYISAYAGKAISFHWPVCLSIHLYVVVWWGTQKGRGQDEVELVGTWMKEVEKRGQKGQRETREENQKKSCWNEFNCTIDGHFRIEILPFSMKQLNQLLTTYSYKHIKYKVFFSYTKKCATSHSKSL